MTVPWSNGEFEAIAEGVYVARCEPAGVNVGLIVGQEEALLIDTGTYPEQGAALMSAAEALAGVPIPRVVVTHAHWDHWFGATGLAARVNGPGAPLPADGAGHLKHTIIGHASLWWEGAADPAELERLGVPEPPAPRVALAGRLDLDLGELPVYVRHLGVAHTKGDLVVQVPGRAVVFVGDLVEESGELQLGPESDGAGWMDVLDRLLWHIAKDAAAQGDPEASRVLIVPGHGRPVDVEFVRAQRAWLADRAPA